jgi:hypothetical protein
MPRRSLRELLVDHHRLSDAAEGGTEVDTQRDAFSASFPQASRAVSAQVAEKVGTRPAARSIRRRS